MANNNADFFQKIKNENARKKDNINPVSKSFLEFGVFDVFVVKEGLNALVR